MSQGVTTIIYPVKDLAEAKELFGKWLGAAPYADSPYYVGFRVGACEVGLDPNGHGKGMTGPVAYIDVDNIQGALSELLGAGAQTLQEPTDVGAGMLIASVTDASGNIIGLRQSP
jgi:predicted enzyme related to lactoylglutathione lyase